MWIPPKDLDSADDQFWYDSFPMQYLTVYYYGILIIIGNEAAPVSTTQTIFVSSALIMGAILMAFIFGNMAALLAAMKMKDSIYQERLDKF